MSRRFGRNQRRRAREALAAEQGRVSMLQMIERNLREALRMDRDLLAHLSRKLAEAEDFQKDVAELVGHEAVIAGEPTTLPFKWDRRDGDRISFAPRIPFSMAMLDSRSDDTYTIRDEVLRLLNIEIVAEIMRPQVHARITLADEGVAYAISESALRRMPRDQLRRTIGEPLLDLLIEQLMKRRK